MVVHAQIELGRVTRLECQDPGCLYPGTPFENKHKRDVLGLSLDHVKMQHEGGSHRPENIRIVHYGCNCGWTKNQTRPTHGIKVSVATWLKKTRELQTASYGTDPAKLEGAELQDYLRTNLLSVHVETAELAQELHWKPWKHAGQDARPTEDEIYDVLMEYVDVLFFLGNIAVALNLTAAELVSAYEEKYEINELRMLAKLANTVVDTAMPEATETTCDRCRTVHKGTRGLAVHMTKVHKGRDYE